MKKLSAFFASVYSYLSVSSIALAQQSANPCEGVGDTFDPICQLGGQGNSVGQVLGSFISLFFVIAAIIAVIYLVYGGIKYITSRGDKTEVENARNQIIAAIVGLILVFLAFFLVNFVLGFLIPGFSINNIEIPTLTEK